MEARGGGRRTQSAGGARPRPLAELDVGRTVYEAAVYYDGGDSPVAREGPSSYEPTELAAEAFARAALRRRRGERPGGVW